MSEKLIIDRHFLFLHGMRLAIFAERILRNLQQSPYIPPDESSQSQLSKAVSYLRATLNDTSLKRKIRTESVRAKESIVLQALNNIADYVEQVASCKSDVFTTGFRPQSERRRSLAIANGTRRQQRMSAKMARLETIAY